MKELTMEHVEHLAHRLAQKTMTWNEPIPEFHTRFSGRLESCLKTPFQTFGGKDPYPRLEHKGALLFYLLIKNHPFQNGNKRIAVASLLVFLALHHKWLEITNEQLYDVAMFVAKSERELKDEMLTLLQGVIRQHLIPFKKT